MNATARKNPAPKPAETTEATIVASAEQAAVYARGRMDAAAAFGKKNLDAALEAGGALVAGVQEISQMWLGLMQGALDDGLGASRRLAACRTTKDMIDAQGEIARASYEKFANESRKLSDLSAKVAGNVSAPLAAQVNVAVGAAVDAFAKPVAA